MSSKQAASKLLGEVFRRQKPKLTHQQVVMRMYRQGLRECRNWNTSHVGYRASCIEIREEFDKYTNVSNPVEVTNTIIHILFWLVVVVFFLSFDLTLHDDNIYILAFCFFR